MSEQGSYYGGSSQSPESQSEENSLTHQDGEQPEETREWEEDKEEDSNDYEQ